MFPAEEDKGPNSFVGLFCVGGVVLPPELRLKITIGSLRVSALLARSGGGEAEFVSEEVNGTEFVAVRSGWDEGQPVGAFPVCLNKYSDSLSKTVR